MASPRPPRGDAIRAAVDALRGYAFQIYGSTLAWTELGENERLHLEVAEDYATVTEDALRAVQAKDTKGSGSVTLNTVGVRKAIDTLVDLADRNPDRTVHLRYLSTSPIGLEARLEDRIEGEAGLAYWTRVATGVADVGPLARRLRAMELAPRVRAYVASRDDDEIRRTLVERIHWDCGQGGIDDTRLEIEARLTRAAGIHGEHVSVGDAESATALLVEQVLLAASKRGPRLLTVTDLQRTLRKVTHLSVPKVEFYNIVTAALRSHAIGPGASFASADPPSWIDRVSDVPLQRRLLSRPAAVKTIEAAMEVDGLVLVSGGTGMGKSCLARLVARAVGGTWHSIDLRTEAASVVAERLRTVLGRIDELPGRGLIVEDLDSWEDAETRRALSALVAAMRRHGRPCLVTTHREPSTVAFEALGIDRSAVFQTPYLDEEETKELVRLAGGRPEAWGRLVRLASAGGHPQLAQAVVVGLEARAWSSDALSDYLGSGTPPELRRERTAARQQLLDAVPNDDVRGFLYRASLVLGRFDRRLALALGSVKPTTPRPGEALDRLVGPWIDEVGPDQFRVSPLVGEAGEATLDLDEQVRVHTAIVGAVMQDGTINVVHADALLFHALRGKVDRALVVIGFGFVRAKPDEKRMLAEWSTLLRFLPTEEPAYTDQPAISLMLRLAQFEALALKGGDGRLGRCARALVREVAALPDDKTERLVEAAVLIQLLMERRLGVVMPEWPDLLVRLGDLVASHGTLVEMDGHLHGAGPRMTLLGMAFFVQCSAGDGVAALGGLFDRVDAMTPERRALVLKAAAGVREGLGLVFKRPIVEEHDRGTLDWRTASASYLRMARQAAGWGARNVASWCLAARAMVIDESGEASDDALGALDEAEAEVGPDVILTRARAKVLWRRGDHRDALPLLTRCLEEPWGEGAVEGTFLAREAAMSAASLGDHATARGWFEEARRRAGLAGETMSAMSVGLTADAAVSEVRLGRGRQGLLLFAECLERLQALDPSRDPKAAYVQGVVGHAILWAYAQLTGTPISVLDGPIQIVPGACSLPEPPGDFEPKLPSSSDASWYVLAMTDVERDLDAGMDVRLVDQLGGRTTPALEVMLRHACISRAVRRSDADAFARDLPPWLEAHAFRVSRRTAGQAEAEDPPLGPLPHVGVEEWGRTVVREGLHAAVTAFALVAAARGEPRALDDLDARVGPMVVSDHVLRRRLTAMASRSPVEGLADEVTMVVVSLGRDPRDPRETMIRSLRLLEVAATIIGSGFGDVVGPALADWIGSGWSSVATQQAFALISPGTSAPAIAEAVASSRGDLASAAWILLTALPAVKVTLDPRLRAMLSFFVSTRKPVDHRNDQARR